MRVLRVLFLGVNELGSACLEGVRRSGARVVAVVCGDRKERKSYFRFIPLVVKARLYGIPKYERIDEVLEDFDIVLVCTWYDKLPADFVEGFEVYNLHPGELPKYKGRNPLKVMLAAGEKSGVITIHRMTDKMDCGEVVLEREYSFETSDMAVLLELACAEAALAVEQFLDAKCAEKVV